MFLEIVFSRDFDPNVFSGLNCKTRGNVVTAQGTMEELNVIIEAADRIAGERTIIIRRPGNEERKEAET